MARPLRIEFPAAVYHVMNRGAARQAVFREPNDYEAFMQIVGDCHVQWGVDVFAYYLMGNHYHLCLRTTAGNLSRVMRHLAGLYTQGSIGRMAGMARCFGGGTRRLSSKLIGIWSR